MSDSFLSVTQGFAIMITFMLIGLILSFGVGLFVDKFHDQATDMGLYDVKGSWDMGAGSTNMMINIFYSIMWGLPIVGVLVFFITLVSKNRYDQEQYQM
jgi:hypothetical protein